MEYSKLVRWDDKDVVLEFDWHYDRSGDPVITYAGFFNKDYEEQRSGEKDAMIMAEEIMKDHISTMMEEDPWWPTEDGKDYG